MKINLIPFLIFTFLSSACIKDVSKIRHLKIEEDISSDWVIPLVNTSLTLKDIVPDSSGLLYVDSQGVYTIQYKNNFFNAVAKDYISIPDQLYITNSIPLNPPISLASYSGTVSSSFNGSFGFSTSNGAKLRTIAFNSGNLNITVNSSFQHNINADITFPTIIKNGAPLTINALLTYPSTSINLSTILTDYVADLSNANTGVNLMPYQIAFTLTGTGQPIASNHGLSAIVSLTDLKFKYIDGFIGTYSIPIPKDSIKIDVFKNASNTNVFLENPQLKFFIESSFGVDAQASFTSLYGALKNGGTNPLGGSFFTNPINIIGPSVFNKVVYNQYLIDRSNSNIQNIINPAPEKIVYAANISINPPPINNGYNFVFDTSRLSCKAQVILPAWFRIDNATIVDSFSISNLPTDTSLVESIELKVRVKNAIGVKSNMQLYFLDASNQIIDSLLVGSSLVLPESTVDAQGNVIASATTDVKVKLTRAQYQNIVNKVVKGKLVANLKTSGTTSVKVKSTDAIQVQMAARAILKLKLDIKNP
jgi:hypothetical protein